MANGDISITHKVMLSTIVTDSDNPIQTFVWALNPGLSIWRWVYRIADAFETFDCPRGRLEFVTSATTDLTGRAYLYFDGDSKDAGATTIAEVSMQYNMQSGNLWEKSTSYNIPNKLMRRSNGQKLFVRRDDQTPSGDIASYDAGNIHFMCNPMYLSQPTVSGLPVGEVWFHYTFNLQIPTESISSAVSTGRRMLVAMTAADSSGTVGAAGDDAVINPFDFDTEPVLNTLTKAPADMSLGIEIEEDGAYEVSTNQDLGERTSTGFPAPTVNSEVEVQVSSDDGKTFGVVESSDSNSADSGTHSPSASPGVNWAEVNGKFILNLLKGEKVKFVSKFKHVIGDWVTKKGLSAAIEYLTPLAPALLLKVKESRSSLQPGAIPTHYKAQLIRAVSMASPLGESKKAVASNTVAPDDSAREERIRKLIDSYDKLTVDADGVLVPKSV
jgi:hypothetical protein